MTSGLSGLLTKTLIFNLTPNLVFATLHPERWQSVWSDIFKEVRPVKGFPELYLFQVWPAALESLSANWANHFSSVRGNSRLAVLVETLIQSQRGSYPVALSTSHSFVCSCRASACEWTFKLFNSESASVQEVQQENGGGNNMPV